MIAMWDVFQRAEHVTVCPVCHRLTLLSELAWVCSDWLVSVLGSRQSSSPGLPLMQWMQLTKIFWCAQGSLDNEGALEIVFVHDKTAGGKNFLSLSFCLSLPPPPLPPFWDKASNSASVCCAHCWHHFNDICLLPLWRTGIYPWIYLSKEFGEVLD